MARIDLSHNDDQTIAFPGVSPDISLGGLKNEVQHSLITESEQ